MDNTVKLWDIKSRELIHSYSCNDTVTALRFTPDGKWVAAASRDGNITIWDLAAARQFCVLRGTLGVPLSIEFHPQQLLLASRTNARCVRFWDLQQFEEFGSTTAEVGQIQAMAFDPTEAVLATASNDSLRTWVWEPEVSAKLMVPQAGWGQVSELSYNEAGELFGASFTSNFVSTWKIDTQVTRAPPRGGTAQPKSRHSRSSSGPSNAGMIGGQKFEDRRYVKYSPDDDDDEDSRVPAQRAPATQQQGSAQRQRHAMDAAKQEDKFVDEQRERREEREYKYARPPEPEFQVQFATRPPRERSPQPQVADPVMVQRSTPTTSGAPVADMRPAVIDEPSHVDLDLLVDGAHTTTLLLSARLPHLRLLQQYWSQGEINFLLTHLETLCSTLPLGDASQASVLTSFFDVINLKASCISLEAAARLFPILEAMIEEGAEAKTVQVALSSMLTLLESFGEMIMQTRGIVVVGVDVAREARIDRCNKCYDVLHRIQRKAPKLLKAYQRDRQIVDLIDELKRNWGG